MSRNVGHMYEELAALDSIKLNFTQGGLWALNVTIGFIMFGVALNIKFEQFRKIWRTPKGLYIGMATQYIFLPLITFIIVMALRGLLPPSIAFGMMLVAACPGGNISNFIANYAHANTALSVSLTAIATVSSVVLTPLNFSFYGNLYAAGSPLLQPIHIDPVDMFITVFLLLGLPVLLGLWFSRKWPKLTDRLKVGIQRISIGIFAVFILVAFYNNFDYFIKYIKWIFLIVLVHNFVALAIGYYGGKLGNLDAKSLRSISIETGIQNSGLALALIFNPKIFPSDMQIGGMAFVAAWWGIWHMVAGLSIATVWRRNMNIETV